MSRGPSAHLRSLGARKNRPAVLRNGFYVVRSERFELSRGCPRQPLKLVRLPVSPRPRDSVDTLPEVFRQCKRQNSRQLTVDRTQFERHRSLLTVHCPLLNLTSRKHPHTPSDDPQLFGNDFNRKRVIHKFTTVRDHRKRLR